MKCALLAALALGAVPGLANAVETPEPVPSAECEAIERANFSSIPDAPTQVTEVKAVQSAGSAPAYCQVKGYVSPQVGFELRLPLENWNKKLLEIGCGGHCGVTKWTVWCRLEKGYACIVSDDGHKGTMDDALWALDNLQAKLDWGYRAAHVTAIAGKAITEYFYRRSLERSYFWGCSTGGRQALQEAQRFPWDFDGILAGSPPIDLSTLYMTLAWDILATHTREGVPILSRADVQLVTNAAVGQCDLDDGVKDGIIGDPRHCKFDAAALSCKARRTSNCLTPSQVDAVKKVYAGPTTASGVPLSPGGPMPGTMGNWSSSYDYAGNDLVTQGLRYLFFMPEMGASWKLIDFDFDRDYKRLGIMEPLYDSSNPDLRKFKEAGGKLIVYQGLNDIAVLPQITEDYYETVERTLGGREATQSFMRLFVLPGVEHCAGGAGADTVDYLGALEAWVERNELPDRLVAAHLKGSPDAAQQIWNPPSFPLDPHLIQFTRPVFPYPTRAKYKGRGDPNDAANFVPIQ